MAAAIRSDKRSVLQAVASRTKEGSDRFTELGATQLHASYATLAAFDEVDVVHIATPHTTHYENALLCLNAGKHVVCEKPLTLSGSHAEALFAAFRREGLFLMEAVWPRFLPAVIRHQRLIREGALGTPQFVSASFALRLDPASHPRIYDPALGGGVVNELGTYPLAFAVASLGPILSCRAMAKRHGAVPEQCLLQCLHAKGLSSGFCALNFQGRNYVTTVGTDGQSTLLPAAGRFEKLSILSYANGAETIEHHPYDGTSYELMVEHVNECIRDGLLESPLMPLAESLNIVSALENCHA